MNETRISVPIPSTEGKFGKPTSATNESNPFGFAETDETHFWYVLLRGLMLPSLQCSHSNFRCFSQGIARLGRSTKKQL
jgi:hypothetical protein